MGCSSSPSRSFLKTRMALWIQSLNHTDRYWLPFRNSSLKVLNLVLKAAPRSLRHSTNFASENFSIYYTTFNEHSSSTTLNNNQPLAYLSTPPAANSYAQHSHHFWPSWYSRDVMQFLSPYVGSRTAKSSHSLLRVSSDISSFSFLRFSTSFLYSVRSLVSYYGVWILLIKS